MTKACDTRPLWLGFDAGGTHTRARLVDAAGHTIGTAQGPSGNLRIGPDRAMRQLIELAQSAAQMAGLADDALARMHVGAGMAGLSRGGARHTLDRMDWPFATIKIVTDAAIANMGAHRARDGAILILGTGSIGHILKDGKETVIGGYGFPISDEGSGAALGLSAIRHALRSLDGRTPSTPLGEEISSQFDNSAEAVIEWSSTATPADFAAFAPIVIQHAENDDEIALSIVLDAVRHIERFISTIFAKGATRCALMGGLAAHISPWLRTKTSERLVEPDSDAITGALWLAGMPIEFGQQERLHA
ncbi:BadF/BadG/BcrA/BcrD ATPase family protein [Croceicoccus marinus]|jgi:glucosamine kinase|uniref:ATPase n=1 Tax=Croceicoccus marinus TaxID=450378 RepID=A0A7G6VZJ2_9SPHN|nr:BadF/BadG/BcrA/BcrD ATPase family protein [Croceicoccus marinus]QNE07157.1 ATPase [Croceicoccus marinus]